MSRKIAFISLGCKLNYAETATYEREFIRHGYTVVPWQEKADIYVINTCAVTERAEKKSRGEIRKVHRVNPQATIAVTGCAAQLRREQLSAIEGVSHVFGAEAKSELVPTLLGLAKPAGGQFFTAYSSGEDRTRAFLKVQDGCDNFCAYCTVPFARGRSRNASICELTRHAREIAASGVREVVLTGVNTGDFGKTTGEGFLALLQSLNEVEGIERYRISSIEPNLLTDEIVDWIASGTKVLPHFHMPLQSASDEILHRMGRRYTTAQFRDRMEYVRAKMEMEGQPRVFFGLDVMVGLPGESDGMFREGKSFIESLRPAFLHVFPYSRRPGTRAAQMPGQVPEHVKAERVAEMEKLCRELHDSFVAEHKGMRGEVLFESSVHDGMMSGYTRNYIKVTRPYDPALVGRVSEVII